MVIVESPAKAKTINQYLGDGYTVMASMGHVRDLPPNDLGIDLERQFEPTYQVLNDRRRVVNELRKAAGGASAVYLATDLDREGEAIAWHLQQALELSPERTQRVVFNEITRTAIQKAFTSPHRLDMDKVNAQQARRLLDRIVGYQLSPLLQMKLGKGLSAGRVQSVAVRLIVEREDEIRAFVPEESWRIVACFAIDAAKAKTLADSWQHYLEGAHKESGRTIKERNHWLSKHSALSAELVKLGDADFNARTVAEARAAAEALGFATEQVIEEPWEAYTKHGLKRVRLNGRIDLGLAPAFSIDDIQTRRTTTKPNPPFTTASLQQAASSSLGFAPARTMRVAQQLYEGIDFGKTGGQVGLITYMRTDSTNLSNDSVAAVRDLIQKDFGANYLPADRNYYGQAKRAQEAHEAIRPTDAHRHPEAVRDHLTAEQFKLYDLIWKRFVACQMVPAQWDSTTILISTDTPKGRAVLRTSGRRLVFDGCLRVTGIGDSEEVVLPELQTGHRVGVFHVDPQQQYTSPPARYTEAALVKKLESEGIGRPSTYAAIIQTVQDRSYVELIEKRLHPTQLGEIVTARLKEHFPRIMDVKFTSYMEDELDKIEESHLDWVHVLGEFYEPFRESLEVARVEMNKSRAEPSEYTCSNCGQPMVYRLGKKGRFLSCRGYPECKTAMNVDRDGKPVENIVAQDPCAQCGKPMILRTSRLGPFLGCTGYPDCDYTLPSDDQGNPLRKVQASEVTAECDECHSKMAVKFFRGKAFLACTAYPTCRATKPIPPGIYVEKPKPEDAGVRCDKCGRPVVIRKSRRGPFLSCSGFPRCRNAMPMEKLDHLKMLNETGQVPAEPPPAAVGRKGRNGKTATKAAGKVDVASLGPPPPGFAWTRTGRPVVEVMPTEPLRCPDCGSEMILKTGRYGPYFGCTSDSKCRFVANLRGEAKKQAEAESPTAARRKPIPTEIPCDECGTPMVIRAGRTGPFLGCGNYPKCKHTKPIPAGMNANNLVSADN